MRFAMLKRVANLKEINVRKKCNKLPTDESIGNFRLADQIRHEIENYTSKLLWIGFMKEISTFKIF